MADDKAIDTVCLRQNETNGVSVWLETNLTRKGDTLQEFAARKGRKSFPKCSNIVSSNFTPSDESERRHSALCNVKYHCFSCKCCPADRDLQNDIYSESWNFKQDASEKRRVVFWVTDVKVRLEFVNYQDTIDAMPHGIFNTRFHCGRERQCGSTTINIFSKRGRLVDGDKNATVGEKVKYLTANNYKKITASVLDTTMMAQIPGKLPKLYRSN